MRNTLVLLILLINLFIKSQTCPVRFDNIESYDWVGAGWAIGYQGNYYTNAFVSSNASAALIGGGSGTSAYELGYYILPNVTALLPTYAHQLTFRLASYRFSNPTAATAGVDLQDYVDVFLSTDGGTTYVGEIRITGNNNAYWDYSSTATYTKVANGALATMGPLAGGNRTTTGDGYSYIALTIPAGATQVAFRLFARANSAGEEWWIDNIELVQLGPCLLLPIELLLFTGENISDDIILKWSTATESNNSYFKIERSLDASNWETVGMVPGSGNTIETKHYTFIDYNLLPNYYFYRLKQIDMNGKFHYSTIIGVNMSDERECEVFEYYNLNGVQIDIESAPAGIYVRKCGRKFIKIFKD